MVVHQPSSRQREDDKHAPLSTAQFQTLLETAHGHRLYPLLLLAGTAGLRRAELISLRWADLDLASRTVLVTRPPKLSRTGTSRTRVVAISEQATAALTRWHGMQARERLTRGPFYHHDGYVFSGPNGRPYRPAQLARVVRTLMRRAGIHHANLHSLRALALSRHPLTSV